MIHHMIVEEECLLFERCSNVSHVPTCAFPPYEIHAPLPACCGIFMLKLSSVPPQLSSLKKFEQFIQRRRFFAITIKISAISFPHFNTHPVTSRFPSFIKVDHIKSNTRICRQYISSIYTPEKLMCLRIFSHGFFYLVGIHFFYALLCITTFLFGYSSSSASYSAYRIISNAKSFASLIQCGPSRNDGSWKGPVPDSHSQLHV